LCETWRKNTLEKQNCFQLEFFKNGGIPKKTELKCLQLDHEVSGTQTFLHAKHLMKTPFA